jgi:hypothetical protein
MAFTMADATLAISFGFGASTLGAAGHRMRTAGGIFGGWISSTVSSSLLLIFPRANVMRDDAVTAGSDPVEALGSGANANQGRPTRHPGIKVPRLGHHQ